MFVTKLKDSAIKETAICQKLFSETDLRVELIEDLSLKVDAVGTYNMQPICNSTIYVCNMRL